MYCDQEDDGVYRTISAFKISYTPMNKLYQPEASVPTDTKNPLTWQNRSDIRPRARLEAAGMKYHNDLNMPLITSNMISLIGNQRSSACDKISSE